MNIATAMPIILAILILNVILKVSFTTFKSNTTGEVKPNSCP